MASLSGEYLIKEAAYEKDEITLKDAESALLFSMSIDLTPMLIAAGHNFNRIPVFNISEGKA